MILLVKEEAGEGSRVFRGVRSYVRTSWQVFRDVPEVRRFLLANAAWEGTFAAMRTFVVLYITQGPRPAALDVFGGARRPSRSGT